jgi:very-short-patch-repair endonuclease
MHGQTSGFIRKNRIARKLRNNATDVERKLWRYLRGRQLDGCKFRRQHPLGHYVLDFVCLERKLVIEVDGSQHADTPHDEARDAYLCRRGYTVLRFWNSEIASECEAALQRIYCTLQRLQPTTRSAQGPLK